VTVDEDGVYGYRLHAVSKQGVAGPKPRSGDQPDVWVCVDSVIPEVEITSIQLEGRDAPTLLIHWIVRDRWLAERPITIEYRAPGDTNWQPVVAGLPNTGAYVWQLDERLPPQVLLRITVRDRAGNEAFAQSPSTVPTHGRAPAVKVRNLRAADR
jgi:hypothetical protein